MSQRKLQQEIDRVFKKVKEGMDEFDFIYDKLQDCDNQSQKEKLENDLKKEIKRLQRFREQIKNWLSGNEVKDKKQLLEHRRLIEQEMERFKEVEKIMKTKAFSNEALATAEDIRVNPRQQEKDECSEFLQNQIEELQRQDEAIEAEIDQIYASMKRKKSDAAKQRQIDELNETSESHRFHIDKLETVLRLLENDNLEIDQVNSIREDIEYYVDSNQDDDFIEDETFYDELGLDDINEDLKIIPQVKPKDSTFDDDVPYVPNVLTTSLSSNKDKDNKSSSSRKVSISDPRPSTTQASSNDHPTVAQTLASQLSLSQNNSPKPKNVILASGIPATPASTFLNGGLKPATPVGTPKLRYASVVSAAVHGANNHHQDKSETATSTTTPSPIVPKAEPIVPSSPGLEINSNSSFQNLVGTSSSSQKEASSTSSQISKEELTTPSDFTFLDSSIYSNLPEGFQNYMKSLEAAKNRLADKTASSKEDSSNSNVPNGKKQKDTQLHQPWYQLKLPQLDSIYPQLESSLLNCPDSYDSDKPKNYRPTNQFVTQPSFPMEPAVDIIGSTKLLKNLEVDTLAYCFYYHNQKYKSQFTNFNNLKDNKNDGGDYLQYITARELSKRGWKYHKDLRIWCHPEESETGPASPIAGDVQHTWKYFDYKDSWMVRRKDNFTFDDAAQESNF